MKETPYSTGFYEVQQSGSLESASVIAPILLSLFPTQSVVDVGCGVGGWLKTFSTLGVHEILGLDGNYVPRELLKIPQANFKPTDLSRFTGLDRRFNLACSLEVAEHLPESSAKQFVSALVTSAPVVLFSAAIPGQGGTEHVNEQWQSYWCKLFANHGYVAVDCIRPRVFGDARVDWWYRQNALVYCDPRHLPAGCSAVTSPYELDRVDPHLLKSRIEPPHSGTEAVDSIATGFSVLFSALGSRLGLDKVKPLKRA